MMPGQFIGDDAYSDTCNDTSFDKEEVFKDEDEDEIIKTENAEKKNAFTHKQKHSAKRLKTKHKKPHMNRRII